MNRDTLIALTITLAICLFFASAVLPGGLGDLIEFLATVAGDLRRSPMAGI